MACKNGKVPGFHFLTVFSFFVFLLLVCAKNAHAYLDPGTGSYIIQIVIAGIFAGWFAVKFLYRRVLNFFSKIFSRNKKNDTNESQ